MVTRQPEEFRRNNDQQIGWIDNQNNNNVKENERRCGNNDKFNIRSESVVVIEDNDLDIDVGSGDDNNINLNIETTRPSYRCSSTGESSNESSLNSNYSDSNDNDNDNDKSSNQSSFNNDHVINIDKYDDRIFYDDEDYEERGDQDKDKEEDDVEEAEKVIGEMGGWTDLKGAQMQKIQHETITGHVLPTLDTTAFGDICIKGSTNVRVGNTTLYKGPVTIKQFLYTNSGDGNGQPKDFINNQTPDANILTTDGSTLPIIPVQQENLRVRKLLWTWRCTALFSFITLLAVLIIVVVSLKLTEKLDDYPSHKPAIDPDDILTDGVRFIQRVEWGAQPPEKKPKKLEIIPAPYVIISHTASESCNNQAECIQRVRLAQTMHIEGNGWDDIGYNFLIGGDGLVYVGRGWDIEGAHAFGFNRKSIGISFIGTFNKETPPRRQIHALEKLIELGVKNEKISVNYKLLGHRQVSETLSPGDVLFGIIKAMDHWSEKP
ncbi:peptidoglycan-recognition protein LC-like isoform X1 [Cotesia glomerata]|uniref:Peptidoglycan recognition protein n=1 Tax=Cotesia glomerata TaxID=32391 RepID=A0AAV7HVK0_COTGL|nr:peptidoglycan-recognition protein LC-like isoform X1 [Cotesia glomerata]KAH0535401.1 hypothetical protein KQX54_016168 [Cotesia glomerata]